MDQLVTAARAQVNTIIYTILQTPGWANGNAGITAPPTNLQDYFDFAAALATRYKGLINVYEPWNEVHNPDKYYSGSVATLVAMTKGLASAVKTADPNARVACPSTAGTTGPEYMDSFLLAGGGAYCDIMNTHYYFWIPVSVPQNLFGPEQTCSQAQQYNALYSGHGYGRQPFWADEGGLLYGVADVPLVADQMAWLAVWKLCLAGNNQSLWSFFTYDYNGNATLSLTNPDCTNGAGCLSLPGLSYEQVDNWLAGATITSFGRIPGQNKVRNAIGAGAAPGVPGAMPTYWSLSAPDSGHGITTSIVGACTDGVRSGISFRLKGTYDGAGTGYSFIQVETSTGIVATPGSYWTFGVYVQKQAGSNNGLVHKIQMSENTNTGAYLDTMLDMWFVSESTPNLIESNYQYFNSASNARTGRVRPLVEYVYKKGVPVDITDCIAAPYVDNGTQWEMNISRTEPAGYSGIIAWDMNGSKNPSSFIRPKSDSYERDLYGNTYLLAAGQDVLLTNQPVLLENRAYKVSKLLPRSADQRVSTQRNRPLVIDLTDGSANAPVMAALQGAPVGGTVTGFPGTLVTFTPSPGFSGAASFQFVLNNEFGTSNPAVSSISVGPPPPVAANETAVAQPGVGVAIDLTAGSSGGPTSAALAGTPVGGTVTGFPGTDVTFTPAAGFAGRASFKFTLANAGGASHTATATVTVLPPPPIAANETAVAAANAPIDIDLTAGSTGSPTSAALVGTPVGGTVTGFPRTTVTFQPTKGVWGQASFQFTVANGGGTSSISTATITVQQPAFWAMSGGAVSNSRADATPVGPHQLRVGTVGQLKLKWFFSTGPGGGVRDTPTADTSGVYFTALDGALYKVNPDTGALIWKNREAKYLGFTRTPSKTSPIISGNSIFIGADGYVIAVNKINGKLLWKTRVDSHPAAIVDSSPSEFNGYIYVGVTSSEEALAITPGYVPSFIGSIVKIKADTGAIVWKTPTAPVGYTGNGVWGSSVVPDTTRGLVYATTGNNYTIPAATGICVKKARNNIAAQRACLDPADYTDSILALDMQSGAIVWSRKTIGADAWNPSTACGNPANTTCPTVKAPYDVDFASGPNLFQVADFSGVKDDRGGSSSGWILGAGQKNGVYWALNPTNGGLFWSTPTASNSGGIQWGSAADPYSQTYVFVALNNPSYTVGNTLVGRNGGAVKNWIGGAWGAINARTGKLAWQIPTVGPALDYPSIGGDAPGALTAHNNIIFGGSTSGTMVAMDNTGFIFWQYNSGAVIQSGPSIFNENVYWGVGYLTPSVANPICGVYAFSFE